MNQSNPKNSQQAGFTLIELMVAILIFAVISVISYRTLSSLVSTKQIVTKAQEKWGGIGSAVTWMTSACYGSIPLVVRDIDGSILPAVVGKDKLANKFDAQLELTVNGYIRDPNYGSTPPKRLGFRFSDDTIYLVTWPVLNRAPNTQPQLDVLVNNVESFTPEFLYPDRQWRTTWPQSGMPIDQMPQGLRVTITMKSGEVIERQWAF